MDFAPDQLDEYNQVKTDVLIKLFMADTTTCSLDSFFQRVFSTPVKVNTKNISRLELLKKIHSIAPCAYAILYNQEFFTANVYLADNEAAMVFKLKYI